jgi:hypothetical protein
MKANESLLFKDEVYQVVGCAMGVLNELGMVLTRSPTNALVVEFAFPIPSSSSLIRRCSTRGSSRQYIPDLIALAPSS